MSSGWRKLKACHTISGNGGLQEEMPRCLAESLKLQSEDYAGWQCNLQCKYSKYYTTGLCNGGACSTRMYLIAKACNVIYNCNNWATYDAHPPWCLGVYVWEETFYYKYMYSYERHYGHERQYGDRYEHHYECHCVYTIILHLVYQQSVPPWPWTKKTPVIFCRSMEQQWPSRLWATLGTVHTFVFQMPAQATCALENSNSELAPLINACSIAWMQH